MGMSVRWEARKAVERRMKRGTWALLLRYLA